MQATAILSETIMLRPAAPGDTDVVEQVWSTSQDTDEPLGRPTDGWWPLTGWATTSCVLVTAGAVVGVAAVEYQPGAEAAEVRVALLPAHRQRRQAVELIRAAIALARGLRAPVVRLYTPIDAQWAADPARVLGFQTVRKQHIMLRRADAALPGVVLVPGVRIRPIIDGEEPVLLQFLNHAWAGTWNFRPITMEALRADLAGQRQGMLVAVDEADPGRILGTCHAMFDGGHRNPDGQPYAWISNLTTDPAARGRGLGRALLTAGLHSLHAQGAGSVALGVDGGATVPLALYRSVGFATMSAVAISERPTMGPSQTGPTTYSTTAAPIYVRPSHAAVDARGGPHAVAI